MRSVFGVMLVLAALMPSVPEVTDPMAIAFAVSAGLLFLLTLLTSLVRGALPMSAGGAWLLLFVALTLFSSATAMLFETPFEFWLRGAVPFVFLLTYFPALLIARKDPQWMLDAVAISSVIWLLSTLAASITAIPAVLAGEVQRITHAIDAWAAFQLPYAMLGLVLTLFHGSRWPDILRWPIAFIFSLMPLLAVSRGQIVAVAAIWMVYIARLPVERRRRVIVPVLLFVFMTFVLVSQTALFESVVERFAKTGSDGGGSRWLEIEYAFDRFLESPLIGKGLGHQIPADIPFAGDWQVIAEAGVDSVGYMHNVAAYLLMNLGLSGFIAYFGFVLSIFFGRVRLSCGRDREAAVAAMMGVCALLWWFGIQASFRQIQSNVLLATLIAVSAALRANRPLKGMVNAQPA